MFQVFIGRKPQKFFDTLDGKTRKRVLDILEALELNPWPAKDFDLAKIEGLEDCFRIRTGRCRISYHVNTKSKEITVYRIERRSETTYKS